MKLRGLIDEDLLLEMANLRGRNVKVPKPLPFSFYFSTWIKIQEIVLIGMYKSEHL